MKVWLREDFPRQNVFYKRPEELNPIMLHAADTISSVDSTLTGEPVPYLPAGEFSLRQQVAQQAFAGLDRLPSIEQLLEEKSVELNREGSLQDRLADGVTDPDGSSSLSESSVESIQVLRDIIEKLGGFWYQDGSCTSWAVVVTDRLAVGEAGWRGVALGFDFPGSLIDPQNFRQFFTRNAEQPGQSKPEILREVQAMEQMCTMANCRLSLLDRCLRLIPLLHACGRLFGSGNIFELDLTDVAQALWGSKVNWPVNCSETAFWALTHLATIRTRELTFSKTEWCVTTQQRGQAIRSIKRLNPDKVQLQLDPSFVEFMEQWLTPDGCRYSLDFNAAAN